MPVGRGGSTPWTSCSGAWVTSRWAVVEQCADYEHPDLPERKQTLARSSSWDERYRRCNYALLSPPRPKGTPYTARV